MQEIKPRYVTFEQAKGFKEKKFNVECKSYYRITGSGVFELNNAINHNDDDSQETAGGMTYVSAPEQWQVVEWASLFHNTDIEAKPVRYAGDIKTSFYQPYVNGCIVNMTKFSTRQEAYSAAFDYILNNNLI